MPWPPPTPGCGPDYHRSVGLSAEESPTPTGGSSAGSSGPIGRPPELRLRSERNDLAFLTVGLPLQDPTFYQPYEPIEG